MTHITILCILAYIQRDFFFDLDILKVNEMFLP